MRNLKKILALALALVMTLSLMTVANAFNDDADIDAKYDEAVTVLSNLKVFQGVNDGSNFAPKQTISRGEVAAIIYRIVTGDVSNTNIEQHAAYAAQAFDDVKATDWDAGYIGYCANAQIIVGDGTNFYPRQKVNGYQALAMILRAIGYDANKEFQGEGWEIRTASTAQQLGLLKNIGATSLNGPATREMVAEILFRTIAEAYVVKYTTAFGYQPVYLPTSENNPSGSTIWENLFGVYATATLGYQTFGLEKTTGDITAVGRKAGTTTLDSTVVAGTSTPWTDIGYAAYAYTVPTPGAKTRTAVSDVVVTGKSVKVTTDSTTIAENLKLVDTDDFVVYYNGVALPKAADGNGSKYADKYWYDTTNNVVKYGAGNGNSNVVDFANGLKVDYVDNDDQGLAEAIVVTEYTVARVAGIANESNTGNNAYVPNTYYFTELSKAGDAREAVKADNLVCASTLAVGNLVTYVQYAGDTYATVAASTVGTLTQINYNVVSGAQITYTIGGTPYVKAYDETNAYVQDYWQGNDILLSNATIDDKTSLVVYTDPYGYMLQVDVAPVDTQYAFVITNEDTDAIPGVTQTEVVYTDGTIATFNATSIDKSVDWNRNAVPQHIYTVSGTTLTKACSGELYGIVYETGTSYLAQNAYLTSTSVVVDIRNVLRGNATSGTVYVGFDEIPTMYNADIHYVTDAKGFVTVAYITDGYNDASKEFVVYTTGANYSQGTNKYYLPVIMDGEITTLELTNAQYIDISKLGVGLYEYAVNGSMMTFTGYTSFAEDWYDVDWQDNALVLHDYLGRNNDYSVRYNSDVNFWTLVIDADGEGKGKTEGAAYPFTMVVGEDDQAFVVTDGTKITDIYVIDGSVAPAGTLADNYTKPTTNDEGEVGYYQYYQQDGYVTDFNFVNMSQKTAAPTANVVDAEGNVINSKPGTLSGSRYTIELTYQEYLKADADGDGKIIVKVDAAAGNLIGVEGSKPSLSTVNYELALAKPTNADVSKGFNIQSIGNAAGEVIDRYVVEVVAAEPEHDATLKISNETTYPNAMIETAADKATGKIGFKGNGKVEFSTLEKVFVATDENANVVWSYTDGTGGTVTGDDILDSADTQSGKFTATVTAEDGTTEIVYTLTEVCSVTAELDNSNTYWEDVKTTETVYVFKGADGKATIQATRIDGKKVDRTATVSVSGATATTASGIPVTWATDAAVASFDVSFTNVTGDVTITVTSIPTA